MTDAIARCEISLRGQEITIAIHCDIDDIDDIADDLFTDKLTDQILAALDAALAKKDGAGE